MTCDFYKFAIDLYEVKKENSDSATIRTCISRMYYSVYHIVYDWLVQHQSKLLSQYNCGSHEKLQFCLKALSRETKNLRFNQLAVKLHDLHSKRCLADYKMQQMATVQHVELMIKEVEQTFSLFKQLTSPQT